MFCTASKVHHVAHGLLRAGAPPHVARVVTRGPLVRIPAVTVPGFGGSALTWRASYALCLLGVCVVRNTYGHWGVFVSAAKAGNFLQQV